MRLNWVGYSYEPFDGYGRYGAHMIKALQCAGVDVRAYTVAQIRAPQWMRAQWGFDPTALTISCLPPYYGTPVPGRHWIYTMTEGSEWPDGWDEMLGYCEPERVLAPSHYNAETIRAACPHLPVDVVLGGTDPEEFPVCSHKRAGSEPYTFLALADRGARKGWCEVYEAFYKAFGGATTGQQDVRLLIKYRRVKHEMLDRLLMGFLIDKRIQFWREDLDSPRQMYERCDVFVAPSYSEGWGMPHREAAMMGIPVITQQYGGLDDGHTAEWSIPVNGGRLERISSQQLHIRGEWMRPNIDHIAEAMRACYDDPAAARARAAKGAQWLRSNQTWAHSAQALIDLITEHDAWH